MGMGKWGDSTKKPQNPKTPKPNTIFFTFMKILIVDDEKELTEPLEQILAQEGYEVDIAAQQSGLQICQYLRNQGDTTPVLFLTAKDTIDDRVAGLDAGADDYLVKPFQLRELLARVRALLRRSPNFEASNFIASFSQF